MEDFYFVYGFDSKNDKRLRKWIPAPEQACIFIGEDWEYDEITQDEAEKIKDMLKV